jgi:hypothetical protein
MRGINVKKYVKPELFYEHYELSEHIADCAWEFANMVDEYSCYALPDEKLAFSFGGYHYMMFLNVHACTITPDVFEDFCYQNGGPGANTFKS